MAKDDYNSRFAFGKGFRSNPTGRYDDIGSLRAMADPKGRGGGLQVQFYSIATKRRAEFPAFITGFSDSFTSNWDSTEAIGRMDPIMNFKNTTRSISLSLEVPSVSRIEAEENTAEINKLIQFLYPTYTTNGSAQTMNGSPLVKVQFQNIIASGRNTPVDQKPTPITIDAKQYGLISAITSLTAIPNFEVGTFGAEGKTQLVDLMGLEFGQNAPFQAIETEAEDLTMQYPKLWTIDLSLTILHDHSLDGNFKNHSAFPYFAASSEAINKALAGDKDAGADKPPVNNNQSSNPNVSEAQPPPAANSGDSGAAASTGKTQTQEDVQASQEEGILDGDWADLE
jgi:hypothetical protein